MHSALVFVPKLPTLQQQRYECQYQQNLEICVDIMEALIGLVLGEYVLIILAAACMDRRLLISIII